jgi:hypothetical protein
MPHITKIFTVMSDATSNAGNTPTLGYTSVTVNVTQNDCSFSHWKMKFMSMSIKRNLPHTYMRSTAAAACLAMLLSTGMAKPSIAQVPDGQSIKDKLRSTLPP